MNTGADNEPEFVVAIGASAGGITAMRRLLPHLPREQNAAFLLAQHLDPSHASMLDEILRREASPFEILVAADRMHLRPECLFIVPPHADCTVRDGALHLEPVEPVSGPRHSIDLLFASIAENFGEHAIGIVLSGTGSDGLQGTRAIKSAGGFAIVQDPAEAEYPGMPTAIVADRLADVIAPVASIGGELTRLLHWPQQTSPSTASADVFETLVLLLVRKTGFPFDQYKQTTLRRRAERRMAVTRQRGWEDYCRLVEASDVEAELLLKDLLISVTSFFRDRDTFDAIRDRLRIIADRKAAGEPIRIWVPGCATGEEAFSIAMLLADVLGDRLPRTEVQIFATDVDDGAIATARRSVFLKSTVSEVPATLLQRYFEPMDGTYRVTQQIRDLVTFASHNLLQDPPFSRLDLVSCRNVLIYFKRATQEKLIRTFHYILNPGGYLVLGSSEIVTRLPQLFEASSGKARIFERIDTATPLPTFARSGRTADMPVQPTRGTSLEQQIREVLYEQYAPPGVLLDSRFNLLHVHGDVSDYIKLPQGNLTTNVLDMVPTPLRVEMRLVTQKSLREKSAARSHPIPYSDQRGRQLVTLVALPVSTAPDSAARVLLLFERQTPSAATPGATSDDSEATAFRMRELEQELVATRDHLQTNIEELETSNEELQSLNEEYQSTAEELQSTNEELQTSNEELQSTNEELSTVNEELQARSDELDTANRDLEDILNLAVSGIVVLDEDLRVSRYSAASKEIFNLLPTSIGRPLIAVGGSVDLALLSAEIQAALETQQTVERELQLGSRVFLVRFIPRAHAGLIISFVDATARLLAAREAQRLAALLNDSHDAITVQSADGRIVAWNRGAERLYGYSEKEALAMNISAIVPESGRGEARRLVERILGGEAVPIVETVRRCKDGREIAVALATTALVNESGKPYAIATTERDITAETALRVRQQEATRAHRARLETAGEMAAGLAHELNQPLTSIVHFCDVALSIARSSRSTRRAELIEALEDTAEQAQRAGDIIRNLRSFVGRREAVRTVEDINAVIRETLHFTEPNLESSNVSVHLALDESVPPIGVDRVQIEQVLVNLLRNAVEAMLDANSETREITISSRSVTTSGFTSIEVTLQDSGPGVSAETIDRLFGPFQTSKPDGLGMGLWISRSIIEAHGGRLWADVSSGRGAKFHFSLPAMDGEGESP